MKGKIVIVTGANSGIGKVAAREMAKMGACVYMLCRSMQRGQAALDEIKAAVPSAELHLKQCDFASMASIRACAADLKSELSQIDVLLNNAGAIFTSREESEDAIEKTFAVNHLGYYLLTVELIDLLKAAAPARIVNVSSEAHRVNSFNFDDFQRTGSYSRSGFQEYGESKMANLLFTYELARRLEGSGVTANALHPGFVRTGFGANNGMLAKVVMTVFGGLMGISAEKGAETSIYLASSPEVEGVTGKYFDKKKEKRSKTYSYDRDVQARLWELSVELTGATLAAE